MKIGILALQGAFAEHEQMLHSLGVETVELRQAKDLEQNLDGLIIPGGESTVQGKLLRELGMFQQLQDSIKAGLPVFGTCAGLILLAGQIDQDSMVHLGTMDMVAVRNAYGRQLGSFATVADFTGVGQVPMTFIRAPYIKSVGPGVEVLARVDGKIVAARQGNQLVTAFHPELNGDVGIHEYFLKMLRAGV